MLIVHNDVFHDPHPTTSRNRLHKCPWTGRKSHVRLGRRVGSSRSSLRKMGDGRERRVREGRPRGGRTKWVEGNLGMGVER